MTFCASVSAASNSFARSISVIAIANSAWASCAAFSALRLNCIGMVACQLRLAACNRAAATPRMSIGSPIPRLHCRHPERRPTIVPSDVGHQNGTSSSISAIAG
jgi:hypothetical protein